MEIGYCLECRELNYAMTNANGTFERANMSNNHEGHKQYIFEAPEKYTPPIRNVLTKLQVGLPISNNEIVLFKLVILSRLVDTFFSRISPTMQLPPKHHSIAYVLPWAEGLHWQSRSSGCSNS